MLQNGSFLTCQIQKSETSNNKNGPFHKNVKTFGQYNNFFPRCMQDMLQGYVHFTW